MVHVRWLQTLCELFTVPWILFIVLQYGVVLSLDLDRKLRSLLSQILSFIACHKWLLAVLKSAQ